MTNRPERPGIPLSEAGRARRERMLPLIQQAMNEGIRRRRRRRSVAGALVLLGAVILGWELLEPGRVDRIEAPGGRLVEDSDRGGTPPHS